MFNISERTELIMHRIMTIIAIATAIGVGVSGCLEVRPYDPVEYNLAVSATVDATRAIHVCNTPSDPNLNLHIQNLNTDTLKLQEFIVNKPDSQELVPAVDQLRQLVNQLLIRHNYTDRYCVHKLSNIQAGSRILSRALSQSNNFDICQNNVRDRFDSFAISKRANLITIDEYSELVNDLLKLEKLNSDGCNLATKNKMMNDIGTIKDIAEIVVGL